MRPSSSLVRIHSSLIRHWKWTFGIIDLQYAKLIIRSRTTLRRLVSCPNQWWAYFLIHLFSFAFGQCSITIRRQIRQFVIERNTSINSTTDCPISKTDWTLVIVNWTLCTTFGISKSFGQWAVSFITLVRMWEVPCQTVWNECRIVLKICHSLRTMLKLCWMTNWNQISPNCYAHLPISLHQLLGEVPSFAPVLNQFWRLATSNCKKVYLRKS